MADTVKCVFCGFSADRALEQTDLSVALYTDDAIKKGHIILAVKDHVTSFSELSAEQAADIFSLGARVAARAEKLIGAEKYYIAAIADVVRHFHIHLLPKMPGEPQIGRHIMSETGWRGEVGTKMSKDELIEFIRDFREARPDARSGSD